jgi:hypothetical protein
MKDILDTLVIILKCSVYNMYSIQHICVCVHMRVVKLKLVRSSSQSCFISGSCKEETVKGADKLTYTFECCKMRDADLMCV